MSRFDIAGLAKQTGAGEGGLGTKNTVMDYQVPVESASPGINTEQMTADETLGHPFPTDTDRGVQFFQPSLAGKCRAASLPRILSGFMGDPVTTPLTGAARKHNFDPVARPTVRAHSILIHREDPEPDITDLLWDAVGNELTLSVETNDWLSFEAQYVATQIDESLAGPAAAPDLTRRFAFYEITTYISVGGGAEVAMPCRSFELTYGNNVPTENDQLGSRRLYEAKAGNRDASLSFTPIGDANLSAFYRRALVLTPQNVKIRAVAVGPVIAGTDTYLVEVILHRLFETEAGADIAAGERLSGIDVNAYASYDSGASKFVEVNVQNIVTGY